MNIKKIILVIFFYFFTFSSSYSLEPDVFVQSTVNRASKILSENLSKDEKINKLKIIAEETVDIRGIGFYTLGSMRKNLDGEQKKKYSHTKAKPFSEKEETCSNKRGNSQKKNL